MSFELQTFQIYRCHEGVLG